MQGWLLKQGAVLRRWTRRFYRLDRGVLSYYPDDKSPRALDSVLLLSPSGVAGAERDEAGALLSAPRAQRSAAERRGGAPRPRGAHLLHAARTRAAGRAPGRARFGMA